MWLFQVLKCDNLPLFLVLPHDKLNIFGIWLLVGQTKTFDEVMTYCCGRFIDQTVNRLIEKIISNRINNSKF